MSDFYTELLVKKEVTMKDRIIKVLLIALTAIAALGGLFLNPLLLLAAVALGIACYFVLPKLDLEYEYLFVNGEMDIDMVMAKSKRKRVKSFNVTEAELMAPLTSHRMDYYNGNHRMKVLDYSSGNAEHKRYAVISRDGEATCKIIIEPDEKLAALMRNCAPSKVFLD